MVERRRIVTVLGTRPEIIKCSTLMPQVDTQYEHTLIHTGQHYDDQMDARFFRELGLRTPDVSLRVGSGTHAGQLAQMLLGIEAVLIGRQPDLVFVQGDTNSTLAGGLAAAKLNIPVCHLEAGCRSFNRAMPEETNRVIVDHLAEILLTADDIGVEHLLNEGIAAERIANVGSTGIDACLRIAGRPAILDDLPEIARSGREYLVATIHRADNTTPQRLPGLIAALGDLAMTWPVILPVHPRTAKVLATLSVPENVSLIDPVGYATMMHLLSGCRALLTDSGGLQEEAAVLGTPTFILREETEWRAFVDAGHHQLVGAETATIVNAVRSTLTGGEREHHMRQPLGLERAGATERTLTVLEHWFAGEAISTSDRMEGISGWNQPTTVSNNRHPVAVSVGARQPMA